MSRHTQQTIAAQQKISNFLFPEDCIGSMPQGFIDFCRKSMQSLHGSQLSTPRPCEADFAATQFDGADGPTLTINRPNAGNVVMLQSIATERPVVAIDTSTVKLGELDDGMLCALRGAVVTLEAGSYRYLRYGPFVFSLGYNGPDTSKSLENLGLTPFPGEPNIDCLLKRVRNVLERWLQFSVSSSVKDAFVLIDGSLTAGTPDNPSRELEHILDVARRSASVMIAISKKTKLRIRNEALTSILEGESNSCLVDVDAEITAQFPPYPVRFLGRVFVAKLARSGFPFRIDIDRQVPPSIVVNQFSQLAGTDIVDQGYPETLRMAHILSTFTATDVLAMQAFAESEFGLELTPKLSLRHSLFGPFGTRWEAFH